MGSNLESSGAMSSLTARRPAANNLPSFELPLPFSQQVQKYGQSLNNLNATQTTAVNIGNLLTPPSTVPGDSISPMSSALNNIPGTASLSNSYNSYAWPPLSTGLTPLGIGSGNTPQVWNSLGGVRGMFSPSLTSSLPRANSNSPTAGEGLPPPPYDLSQLPPLPTSMSVSAPTSLPGITAQQQAMAQAYMSQNQGQQTPVSATTQPSPLNGTDSFAQRPQSNPTNYYSQSQPSSAHQAHFPSFNSASSPIQQSPMSAPPQTSRISPTSSHSGVFPPPSSQSNMYGRSSYGSYSLPALASPAQMNGPILSNVHNPHSQMAMMGLHNNGLPGGMIPGYHSGIAAGQISQLYGSPQPPPHSERPFKCDQCPQSFNRNHDLKRHKRIHLAVKPFPCGHCEKSFSRKDALKRHILVKGCGKGTASSGDRESPEARPRTASEDSDDATSPIHSKHAL